MEPVDRKNVKEIVGADRAVTKMLCHYFVSVNTGEGFFCLFSFFFLIEMLVDRIIDQLTK